MNLDIKGLKEIDERLVLLGQVAGARIMRAAMFAASKPILEQAKSNIRSWSGGSGALYQSMGRLFKVTKGRGEKGSTFTVQVGPRRKVPVAVALYNLYYKVRKRPRRSIYYGHFLEFGHRIGTRKTGSLKRSTRAIARSVAKGNFRGLSGGTVQPKRFLRPALDTAGVRAVFILKTQLRKRVNRALKKQDASAENI